MKDITTEPGQPRTDAPRKPWHGLHKALADPLRIRLLEWLFEAPRSARQLADCAGLPADRLYYHLGQLQQARLIEVAEYRPLARGKVERVYAPAQTEPPGDDADPEETAALLGSMLQATAMDITAACRARQAGARREIDLHLGTLRLTDEALAELRGHIQQLTARFAEPGSDGTVTRVVLALVDLQDRADAEPPPGSPA
ncbi:MAG TPA: winged helix-turn-helix domain-containing protein [Streptosporangiaceae bacterium]